MKPSRLQELSPKKRPTNLEEVLEKARTAADQRRTRAQAPAWLNDAVKDWTYESGKPLPMKVRRSELAREAMQILIDALDGDEPLTEETHRWVASVCRYFMHNPNGNSEEGHYWLAEFEDQRGLGI